MSDIIEFPSDDDEPSAGESNPLATGEDVADSEVDAQEDEPAILGFPSDDTDSDRDNDGDAEDEDDDDSEDDEYADFDEPMDDLDEAYRQALEKIDEAEWEIGQALTELNAAEPEDELESEPIDEAEVAEQATELVNEFLDQQPANDQRLTPEQIIEASLFVGGQPLTAKKLAGILKGNFNADFVATTISQMTERYLNERRPYEIRLGEGGYELKLRYQFENIRHRVFGLGPKEVKLSQEALEVLSLVAYHQPVSAAEIEETGKSKPTGILRQLLRRELIALERQEKSRKKVKYVTTDRFLQVFGLGDIDELPMLGDIDFK